MAKLEGITEGKSQLEMLKALALVLADQIDSGLPPKDLGPIAKQYRETINEIEQIEGMTDSDDEISEILSTREADGKSGAVR